MIAIDFDRERAELLKIALETGHTTLRAAAVHRGRPSVFDLIVAVPPRAAARNQELYVNLYLADLPSPSCSWNPRPALIYPDVTTISAPFTHTFRRVETYESYVGILVSVATATHEEVDWCCKILRASDGREIKDCRRAG